jgi:PAS domain S-box-containing protein
MFGYAPHEVVGKNLHDTLHYRYPDGTPYPRSECPISRAGVLLHAHEDVFFHKDGREIEVSCTCAPITDETGQVTEAALIIHDITERRRVENELHRLNESLEDRINTRSRELEEAHSRLMQAQKMEAVGHLTGGIAHDFNNLLTVIVGNIELLRSRFANDTRTERLISGALAAAERGERLTAQLLSFSRKQRLSPERVNLNEAISEMSELLARAIGDFVTIRTDLETKLPQCYVDKAQLQSAVVNLVINAKDAMVGGKNSAVTIRTRTVQFFDENNAVGLVGSYVCLSVEDNGVGMSEGVRQQAFEPFFTTKDIGQGTGLGLSQVWGFAKQSNGTVSLESRPNQGTTVSLYLPQVMSIPLPKPHDPEVQKSKTILVVEDDNGVREFAIDVLSELGYNVIAAEDGRVGVHVLTQRKDEIDLVFTDIVMPGGMNGFDVARECARITPTTKVMFTSGYAESIVLRDQSGISATAKIINKPYRPVELARELRQALYESDDDSD